MPSPAIATLRPSRLQALDHRALAAPARPRPRPRRCRASARPPPPRCAMSPVSMTMRTPVGVQGADRLRGRRLDRVGDREQADHGCRPTATNTTVCPSARSASARAARAAGGDAAARRAASRCRAPRGLAGDHAGHAHARQRAELARRPPARCRAPRLPPGPRRRAGARCRARAPPRAEARRPRLAPSAATTAVSRGFPSVSVPVLSTTSVSIFSNASSASALRIRTPEDGAAADADHDRHRRGEAERARAGDDQHRHRVDERVREARLGAERRPRDEGERRSRDHDRHEHRRDPVREALDRGARCAAPRRPSRRCARAACRRRRARRASRTQPVPLTVAPVTLLPAAFSTGIGSPVSIDSSTEAGALLDDAVDRHLLAGAHAQAVAGLDLGRAGRRARCRRAGRRRAVFGARPRSARIALPVRARAESSSTWPRSTRAVITAAASK